ncbi:MAG: M56 family metallopeptidase [Butyrivibrio sp.]|nr:M56 family metallopeptidase [Butyrivibrio sp.]
MLNFKMNMPFVLMAFYGSLMIIVVLLLRALLKRRLPKFVFPVLWCVILIRLLIPFNISSPLSLKAGDNSILRTPLEFIEAFSENFAFFGPVQTTVVQEAVAADVPMDGQQSAISEAAYTNTYTSSDTSDTVIESAAEDSVMTVAYSGMGSGSTWLFPRQFPFTAIYFMGLSITIIVLLVQKYRYNMRLKNCLLIEHNETINGILREMDMGHILVFTNDDIASPLVCGLLNPRIYLPTRMDFHNTELIRHILSHETMHIRRKDNWIKAVMLIAICLNWFNPLIWIMSKCLASDLETACDEAVIRKFQDEDARKSYAFSLLSMAITSSRTTLLYSSFSKTEVEKRIRHIISYKKTSFLLICMAVMFILCSSTVFATCPQAPFYSQLTSYCASSNSRWAVKVELTRDAALGENAENRAERIIFNVLNSDTTEESEIIKEQIIEALSEEFHVEKGVFEIYMGICISNEEQYEEYASWGLEKDETSGYFMYQGEQVRKFIDKPAGFYQTRPEGTVDITIRRDNRGYIIYVQAYHEGDAAYDNYTMNNVIFTEH